MMRALRGLLVLVLAVLAAACSSGVSTPASSVVSPTFPPPWTPATAAAPATPPPAPMQTFTGTGPDVVDLQQPVGFGIIVFSCPKCTGNTIVKTDARIDNLIVNRIGPYGGQHWIGARGDETSRVQVTAKGDWKLIVGDLSLARRAAPGQAVSGTGDEVVLYSTGPEVTLVDLRHLYRPSDPDREPEESGRTYRHRWVVRGHWKNAWRPSVQQHRRIWVPAYVKGPDGAPLLQRERVNVWRR